MKARLLAATLMMALVTTSAMAQQKGRDSKEQQKARQELRQDRHRQSHSDQKAVQARWDKRHDMDKRHDLAQAKSHKCKHHGKCDARCRHRHHDQACRHHHHQHRGQVIIIRV